MARRFLISHEDIAQPVTQYAVAVGGVVKHIVNATVADSGVARQYWPPGEGDNNTNPGIKWGAGLVTVRQSVEDPADSTASIKFYRQSGGYQYSNYPNPDSGGLFLSPALDGTAGDNGKYVIRCVQNSGDALTGTLATWVDLNADFEIKLVQTVVGVLNANSTISIAEDNGSGSPVVATQIDKTVTFFSEVRDTGGGTGSPNIGWDAGLDRDLVHIVEGGDAFCIMSFYPTAMIAAGIVEGRGDTSGSFQENWLADGGDHTGMTIRCDVISGTPPNTGSALATDLPLDTAVVQQWILLTDNPGDDLSNVCDYTLKDGANTSTKRVTMHSQHITNNSDLAWSAQPMWVLEDLVSNRPTQATITLGLDGIALGDENSVNKYTEDWTNNSPATNPELYEAKLTVLNGVPGIITGSAVGSWVNMASGAEWVFGLNTGAYLEWGVDLEVRFIGQLAVKKRIIVTLGEESNNVPPGGQLP